MNAKTQKSEARQLMLEILAKVWPEAKLGRTSFEDLEWLIDIVKLMGHKSAKGMSAILNKYRARYEDSVTSSGRKSKRCGDEVSVLLTGLTGTEAIRLAERVCDLEPTTLMTKYEGLNEGSRKMNAANRIRGAVSRGDIIKSDIEDLINKPLAEKAEPNAIAKSGLLDFG